MHGSYGMVFPGVLQILKGVDHFQLANNAEEITSSVATCHKFL